MLDSKDIIVETVRSTLNFWSPDSGYRSGLLALRGFKIGLSLKVSQPVIDSIYKYFEKCFLNF